MSFTTPKVSAGSDAVNRDIEAEGDDEELCPTCGALFRPGAYEFTPHLEESRPIIWPWFLILVGIFFIVTFAFEAVDARQVILATWEPAANDIPGDLAPALAAADWMDLDHDLDMMAVGGIFVLAGISVARRSRLSRHRPDSPSESQFARALLLDLWKAGETVLVSVAVVVLALAGFIIGRHLLAGVPPSWYMLEATMLHLRDSIAAIIAISLSRPILPPGWTT